MSDDVKAAVREALAEERAEAAMTPTQRMAQGFAEWAARDRDAEADRERRASEEYAEAMLRRSGGAT